MNLSQFPHLEKKARQIFSAMRRANLQRPLTVSFVSEDAAEAAVRVMRQKFRKPFIQRGIPWVKQRLLKDIDAFIFLSHYIEIHLGEQHWTTWGMLVHPLEQLPAEVAMQIVANIGPCYVRIDLGKDPSLFAGLLQNLKSYWGDQKPARSTGVA